MTRIHIVSDLHLNHYNTRSPMAAFATESDIAIVAGDISVPDTVVADLQHMLPNARHIVFVAGNHEHYNGLDMSVGHQRMREDAEDTNGRVHFLENESVVIEGVRFIGATLWTDYNLYDTPAESKAYAAKGMSDHWLIMDKGQFTPDKAALRHITSKYYIESELAKNFAGDTVVITHHCPSSRSIAPHYAGSPLNPAFASKCDTSIKHCKLWVHGHTHSSFNYKVKSGARVVCNPAGYPDYHGTLENPGFNPELVFNL